MISQEHLIMQENDGVIQLSDSGREKGDNSLIFAATQQIAVMYELDQNAAVGSRMHNELHTRITTDKGPNAVQKESIKVPMHLRLHMVFGAFDIRSWKIKEWERKQKEQEEQEQKGEPKKKEEEKKPPPPSPTTKKLDKEQKTMDDKYADQYPKSTYKPFKPDKEYRIMLRDLQKRKKSFPNTRKGRTDFNWMALGEYRRYHMDMQENERDPKYKKQTDPETRKKNKQYIHSTKPALKKLEWLHRDGKKKLKEDKKKGTASDDTPEKWKEDKDKDATKVMSDNQPTMEGGDSKPEKNEKSDRPPFNALSTLNMFLSNLKYDSEGGNKSKKEKNKEDNEKMRAFIKALEIEIKENPSDPKVQKANEGILADLKKLFPPIKEKKKKSKEKGGGKEGKKKSDESKQAGGDKSSAQAQEGKKSGEGSASQGRKGRSKKKGEKEEPSPHGHKRRRSKKKGGEEEPSPHGHKKQRRKRKTGGDEVAGDGHKHRRRRRAKSKEDEDDQGDRHKGKRGSDLFVNRLNAILRLLRRKRRGHRHSLSKKEESKLRVKRKTLIRKLQELIEESANDHEKSKIYHSKRIVRKEKRRIRALQARLEQIEVDEVNTRAYRIHKRRLRRKIRRIKKIHLKAIKNEGYNARRRSRKSN